MCVFHAIVPFLAPECKESNVLFDSMVFPNVVRESLYGWATAVLISSDGMEHEFKAGDSPLKWYGQGCFQHCHLQLNEVGLLQRHHPYVLPFLAQFRGWKIGCVQSLLYCLFFQTKTFVKNLLTYSILRQPQCRQDRDIHYLYLKRALYVKANIKTVMWSFFCKWNKWSIRKQP